MRIVICDDRAEDRALLLGYCERYGREREKIAASAYDSGGALLSDARALDADLLLLDIYLAGASGLDAARILRGRGYEGGIVLTTTSRDHYADGYEIEALHYLVKPITYEAFCRALTRARKKARKRPRLITVTCGRRTLLIPAETILYAEVYNHQVQLRTTGGALDIKETLAALMQELGGEPFLRCFRSCVVNMDFVTRLEEDAFLMKDGKRLPVSRDGRGQIKSRYMAYLFAGMEGR